jgi:hypothetical protein
VLRNLKAARLARGGRRSNGENQGKKRRKRQKSEIVRT